MIDLDLTDEPPPDQGEMSFPTTSPILPPALLLQSPSIIMMHWVMTLQVPLLSLQAHWAGDQGVKSSFRGIQIPLREEEHYSMGMDPRNRQLT